MLPNGPPGQHHPFTSPLCEPAPLPAETPSLLRAPCYSLQDKHSVPKGVKTVLLFYGVPVDFPGLFKSCKGRDEHQQGAFRKVKICDKMICSEKSVSRSDKDICLAGSSSKFGTCI